MKEAGKFCFPTSNCRMIIKVSCVSLPKASLGAVVAYNLKLLVPVVGFKQFNHA